MAVSCCQEPGDQFAKVVAATTAAGVSGGDRASWFQPEPRSPIDDAKLTEALRSLSDKHREVIVAKIWGGLPFE